MTKVYMSTNYLFTTCNSTREIALIGRTPKATRISASLLAHQVATNAALGIATQHAMYGTAAGGGGRSYK